MRATRDGEVTDQLGGGHIDSPACLIGAAPATPLPPRLGLIEENNFYDFNSNRTMAECI